MRVSWSNTLLTRGVKNFFAVNYSTTPKLGMRSYKSPRLYLDFPDLMYFNFLKFFKNISIIGEYHVYAMRRKFFNAMTFDKEP